MKTVSSNSRKRWKHEKWFESTGCQKYTRENGSKNNNMWLSTGTDKKPWHSKPKYKGKKTHDSCPLGIWAVLKYIYNILEYDK